MATERGTYDDARYGVIQRKWFGLHKKLGGDVAAPYTPVAGSATAEDTIARWYPRGPIKVLKVGYMVVATASAAANATGASDRANIPLQWYKSNASGTAKSTLVASDVIDIHPTVANLNPLWTIGSKETIASAEIEAGRFLTLHIATAQSNEGTAAAAPGTTLASGSFAFFVDWKPIYNSKWYVNS